MNLKDFLLNKQAPTAVFIFGLIMIWLLLIFFVNPLGDFPLNDDWAYGQAVFNLVELGKLQFSGWQSMPLIVQVLWGMLFCLPLGFSFTALRFSTLVLGLVGVVTVYLLFRQVRARHSLAFLGALLLAINPLYFSLANTFMTDVPFFALSMLAVLFFIRGLENERKIDIGLATLFVCAATLIRQLGLVISLAFLITYFVKNGFKTKNFIMAVYPAFINVTIFLAYNLFLQFTVGLPTLYTIKTTILTAVLQKPLDVNLLFLAKYSLLTLLTLGLFLAPFLLLFIWSGRKFILQTFIVFILALLFWLKKPLPLLGNILIDFGVGPLTLRDTYILGLEHFPTAPQIIWWLLTLVALFAAVCLLDVLRRSLRKDWRNYFVVLIIAGYFLPIALVGVFDRYLIFLLPLLMVLIIVNNQVKLSRTTLLSIVILLLVGAGFTSVATHDYLAWNRARWQALHYLTYEKGVSPQDIDGGFEFNGWFGYHPAYRIKPGLSWWWVNNDDYVVAFGFIAGYQPIKSFVYKRYFPWGEGNIFVLKKEGVSE